jgi:hypothetical protein
MRSIVPYLACSKIPPGPIERAPAGRGRASAVVRGTNPRESSSIVVFGGRGAGHDNDAGRPRHRSTFKKERERAGILGVRPAGATATCACCWVGRRRRRRKKKKIETSVRQRGAGSGGSAGVMLQGGRHARRGGLKRRPHNKEQEGRPYHRQGAGGGGFQRIWREREPACRRCCCWLGFGCGLEWRRGPLLGAGKGNQPRKDLLIGRRGGGGGGWLGLCVCVRPPPNKDTPTTTLSLSACVQQSLVVAFVCGCVVTSSCDTIAEGGGGRFSTRRPAMAPGRGDGPGG